MIAAVLLQLFKGFKILFNTKRENATSGVDGQTLVVTSAFQHNRVMTSTMAPRQIFNEGFPNPMHAWGEDQVLQVIRLTLKIIWVSVIAVV